MSARVFRWFPVVSVLCISLAVVVGNAVVGVVGLMHHQWFPVVNALAICGVVATTIPMVEMCWPRRV